MLAPPRLDGYCPFGHERLYAGRWNPGDRRPTCGRGPRPTLHCATCRYERQRDDTWVIETSRLNGFAMPATPILAAIHWRDFGKMDGPLRAIQEVNAAGELQSETLIARVVASPRDCARILDESLVDRCNCQRNTRVLLLRNESAYSTPEYHIEITISDSSESEGTFVRIKVVPQDLASPWEFADILDEPRL